VPVDLSLENRNFERPTRSPRFSNLCWLTCIKEKVWCHFVRSPRGWSKIFKSESPTWRKHISEMKLVGTSPQMKIWAIPRNWKVGFFQSTSRTVDVGSQSTLSNSNSLSQLSGTTNTAMIPFRGLYKTWFPTLERTLVCLSKLYLTVDVSCCSGDTELQDTNFWGARYWGRGLLHHHTPWG
jgi:hypothetical protein